MSEAKAKRGRSEGEEDAVYATLHYTAEPQPHDGGNGRKQVVIGDVWTTVLVHGMYGKLSICMFLASKGGLAIALGIYVWPTGGS